MTFVLNSLKCPDCKLDYDQQDRKPFLDICTHTRCQACFERAMEQQVCGIDGCREMMSGAAVLNPALLKVVEEIDQLRRKHLQASSSAYGSLAAPPGGLALAQPPASAPSPSPAPYHPGLGAAAPSPSPEASERFDTGGNYGGFAAAQQSQFQQRPFLLSSIPEQRGNGVSLRQVVNVSKEDAEEKLRDMAPGNFILSHTTQKLPSPNALSITYRLNFVPKTSGSVEHRLIQVAFIPKYEGISPSMDSQPYDRVRFSLWRNTQDRVNYDVSYPASSGKGGVSGSLTMFTLAASGGSEHDRFQIYQQGNFWPHFEEYFEKIMDRGL